MVAAAVAAVLVVAICVLSFYGMNSGAAGLKESELFRYQAEKLDRTPNVDILLVGDSSLGNAIDARDWSRRLDLSVVSVPLVASYGYEGTLNMLKRAVRRSRPQVVVVMSTIDMMARKPSTKGMLYTVETIEDLGDVPPSEILSGLATWDIAASMFEQALIGGAINPAIYQNDFSPQNPKKIGGPLRPIYYRPEMARPKTAASLRRIGDFCRAENLTCLYANGPYLDPQCSGSTAYVDAIRRIVRDAGLTLVDGTPVCMPRQDAGDSEDHVAVPQKPRYSEIYRRLIMDAAARAGAWPGIGAAVQASGADRPAR